MHLIWNNRWTTSISSLKIFLNVLKSLKTCSGDQCRCPILNRGWFFPCVHLNSLIFQRKFTIKVCQIKVAFNSVPQHTKYLYHIQTWTMTSFRHWWLPKQRRDNVQIMSTSTSGGLEEYWTASGARLCQRYLKNTQQHCLSFIQMEQILKDVCPVGFLRSPNFARGYFVRRPERSQNLRKPRTSPSSDTQSSLTKSPNEAALCPA